MKTLNDKITCTFSIPASATELNRTYTVNDEDGNAIFYGSVFIPSSDTTLKIEICLNDILKSEVEKTTILEEYNPNLYNPIRTYTVSMSGIARSVTISDIFLGYGNLLHNYPTRCLLSRARVAVVPAKQLLAPMLQGLNTYSFGDIPSQKLELYPKYPFVDTDLLNISQLLNVGIDHDTIQYGILMNGQVYVEGAFSHKNYVDNLVVSLEDFAEDLPASNAHKDIVLQSSALTHKVVSGTKLWKVEIDGTYLYEDQDIWSLLEDFGYPGLFYSECFYILNGSTLLLPIVVETNDPINDIQRVWDKYPNLHVHGRTMRYTEVLSVPNCILSYDSFGSSPLSFDTYNSLCKFMLRLSYNYINSAIVIRWGILPNRLMPDTVLMTMPFIVPDIRQLDIWKTYFEEFEDKDTYTYEDFFVYGSGEKGSVEGKTSTYKEEEVPAPIKIAEFDDCNAKYYLQWIDRFGGVQCLPFKGKQINSISYNTTNITNRYGEKRPISSENTYTFDLNTGWLTENQYALYESIFISPDLKLYDTENDMSYHVIVADKTFEEKTFNNQKKMFGFNIKLQINNTETVLY